MNQPNMDPKTLEAQQALVRILNTPPETIVSMLDRLEIPWEKKKDKQGVDHLVIKWSELVKGERRLQQEGPFIKTLIEELRTQRAQSFSGEQINPLTTKGL